MMGSENFSGENRWLIDELRRSVDGALGRNYIFSGLSTFRLNLIASIGWGEEKTQFSTLASFHSSLDWASSWNYSNFFTSRPQRIMNFITKPNWIWHHWQFFSVFLKFNFPLFSYTLVWLVCHFRCVFLLFLSVNRAQSWHTISATHHKATLNVERVKIFLYIVNTFSHILTYLFLADNFSSKLHNCSRW